MGSGQGSRLVPWPRADGRRLDQLHDRFDRSQRLLGRSHPRRRAMARMRLNDGIARRLPHCAVGRRGGSPPWGVGNPGVMALVQQPNHAVAFRPDQPLNSPLEPSSTTRNRLRRELEKNYLDLLVPRPRCGASTRQALSRELGEGESRLGFPLPRCELNRTVH